MNEMHYARVAACLRDSAWALDPRRFCVLLDLLQSASDGERLTREQIHGKLGHRRAGRPDVRFYREDGELVAAIGQGQRMGSATEGQPPGALVAVIGVYGYILQRSSQMEEFFGPAGTSVQRLTARFRAVMADPTVKAVVFDVDSPGGGIYGVPELAAEVLAARGRKPIEAVANALAASAAFYIASSANQLWVTPSGEVGSIGVYSLHVDLSQFFEAAGARHTLISYGENKVLGNPFEPLGEAARADMEKRVNEYGREFDRAVARSRNVTTETVRKQFGQGLVFGAKEAAQRGLADGTATLDEVVTRLTRQRPAQAAPPAASVAMGTVAMAPTPGVTMVTTVTVTTTGTGVQDFAEAERIAAAYRRRLTEPLGRSA